MSCAWHMQVDPFFMPVTEEEREEFGEEGQGVGAPNLARRLIDAVRRRKGLAVEEKVRGSRPCSCVECRLQPDGRRVLACDSYYEAQHALPTMTGQVLQRKGSPRLEAPQVSLERHQRTASLRWPGACATGGGGSNEAAYTSA